MTSSLRTPRTHKQIFAALKTAASNPTQPLNRAKKPRPHSVFISLSALSQPRAYSAKLHIHSDSRCCILSPSARPSENGRRKTRLYIYMCMYIFSALERSRANGRRAVNNERHVSRTCGAFFVSFPEPVQLFESLGAFFFFRVEGGGMYCEVEAVLKVDLYRGGKKFEMAGSFRFVRGFLFLIY